MTTLAVEPEETVTTPYWQLEAEPAGVGAMLRRAPVTVRSVLGIMVAAAPAATAPSRKFQRRRLGLILCGQPRLTSMATANWIWRL